MQYSLIAVSALVLAVRASPQVYYGTSAAAAPPPPPAASSCSAGNYCAGGNIILRCNDGVLQPGNCADNLGEPQFGATCIETVTGAAECSALPGPTAAPVATGPAETEAVPTETPAAPAPVAPTEGASTPSEAPAETEAPPPPADTEGAAAPTAAPEGGASSAAGVPAESSAAPVPIAPAPNGTVVAEPSLPAVTGGASSRGLSFAAAVGAVAAFAFAA